VKPRDDKELTRAVFKLLCEHDSLLAPALSFAERVAQREDTVARILDAIDRRTPTAPTEPPREQCPKCASTGAWTCGEECFYEADEGPPAATPGTAPAPGRPPRGDE
jgi:hypothetical protein